MSDTNINNTYQETLTKLKTIFDYINLKFFNNELPEILITMWPDKPGRKVKYAAWFMRKSLWNYNGEQIPQINLCSEYLKRSWLDIAECLLHEAVHQYCFIKGKPGKGTYHDLDFKEEAERHGLIVEKTKNGWSKTKLHPTSKMWLQHFLLSTKGFESPSLLFRELPPVPTPQINAERVPKNVRFQCPICEIIISTSYPLLHDDGFECKCCGETMIEIPAGKRKLPKIY